MSLAASSAILLARAARLPAPLARGAVGSLLAIECGQRRTLPSLRPRDARKAEIARRAWELRQPVIARWHAALDRLLGEAQHETLAMLGGKAVSSPPDPADFRQARETDMASPGGGARQPRPAHSPQDALPLVNAESDGSGVAADFTFDLSKFAERFMATIRTEAAATLQEAGQQMLDEVAWRDPFAMPEPAALRFLEERENLLKDVPQEIFEKIKGELAEGMEAGESIRKLQQRVVNTFGMISDVRAKTIASNETAAAYARARQAGMEQSGVQRKSWICSHIRSRFTHEEAELDPRNEKIPVGEAFHVGAVRLLAPGIPQTPADNDPGEIINCHCMAYAEENE